MKNRKSVFTLLLVLMFSFVFTACGAGNGNKEDNAEGNQTPNETSKGKTSLLDEIKDRGVLKVGLMGTYRPYNFLNEKQEMDGFDADIAKEVAKRLGVNVEFIAQEFSGMIAGLQAEKFDVVISQMTITDERKQQMDFSDPYITNQVKVIVHETNDSIKSVEDFKGKNIGVGLGTNDETYLRTKLMPEVGEFKIMTYNDVITTLKDLDADRIDATINNIYALKPVVEEQGFKIKAVGEAIKSDQAGIATRKGNEELVAELNRILAEMKEDGTYKEIFVKWFEEEPQS
ncbi:amino acid ABC transporter substrate-binding protein, PAAT family [Schinkia azotoformans MEV2011]|uniref:Amino acid ABC transporter substrate-binding protein, PAAT family n=1 Tax=Schinkia azotoformans MEV2011 TaxID=1348973 RepID=A0A072NU71_SCHAZ|nr:transporter substrate-binding domain-containing protein [Schinkia azotoformans]KEF36790.1 amino acid ABC transporter substrate-binding protein, PAAT family [Schinkia azotoformans MEV2011]MEC1698190.1 transporter substrate-binding domain-containing protein [Schinkia azotoformans]MEC1718019.1 transporter substrate-binding domain-containing protein [Schinkia azotoformans]MEC1725217.1 transporter substrate-binding domain-containing protein [Schinkia azotoformans]MEC1739642.1 transporter substra